MEQFNCGGQCADFSEQPLIVSVPAVGNVGQLAVDLLISQSGARRCAILESPDVLPIAGHGAFAAPQSDTDSSSTPEQPSLVTSLEIYCANTESGRCYIVQQRGPVATGRQVAFSESLVEWIVRSKFSSVLLLGSVDAAFRIDKQLQGSPIYAVSQNCPQLDGVATAPVADMGAKPLEDRRVAPWPLYRLCGAAGLPTTLLVAYAADGNNIPEALMLASATAPAVPAGLCPALSEGAQWRIPPSWAPLLAKA